MFKEFKRWSGLSVYSYAPTNSIRKPTNVPGDSLATEYILVWMKKLCIVSGKSSLNKVQSYAVLARGFAGEGKG